MVRLCLAAYGRVHVLFSLPPWLGPKEGWVLQLLLLLLSAAVPAVLSRGCVRVSSGCPHRVGLRPALAACSWQRRHIQVF